MANLHRELWNLKKKQEFSSIFQARISNILKYFLSETIHAQENGSWGTHFAKSLNSNFLKGLTYSALTPLIRHHAPLLTVFYYYSKISWSRSSFLSSLVSGGVSSHRARCMESFWRGLPHQHIVGFHILELYILVLNMSQFVAGAKFIFRYV